MGRKEINMILIERRMIKKVIKMGKKRRNIR